VDIALQPAQSAINIVVEAIKRGMTMLLQRDRRHSAAKKS
jgi:hypothetical protein